MDIWGRANDDCDTEAKVFWQDEDDKGTKAGSMKLTNEQRALWIGDEHISTQVIVTMYNHIHDPQAVRKWQERGVDNEELRDMVDIKARRKVGKVVGIPRRLWVMKHRHRMMGIGHSMKRWKYRSMAKSPHCGHPDETARHVTKYEKAGSIERWNNSLEEVGAWLTKLHTHPILVSLLLSRLTELKTGTRQSPLHARYPDISELQEAYDEI
jgi:hypothetical protein